MTQAGLFPFAPWRRNGAHLQEALLSPINVLLCDLSQTQSSHWGYVVPLTSLRGSMVKATIVALILATGTPTLVAQQPTPADFEAALQMPLRVELVRDLNSSKAHVGDIIELKYFGELKSGSGVLMLNEKAKLYGRVSDVAKRDKEQPARLGIVVERAEFDGKSIVLKAVLCGGFMTAPQYGVERVRDISGDQNKMTFTPGTSGLPDDANIVRTTDGAVLVSKKDNINIATGTGFYVCQQREKTPAPVADTRPIVPPASLPAGVTFAVALNEPVNAATAKPGDTVSMMMVGNLRGPNNTIAIPKGANIIGRIVIAEPASKSSPSRIGIIAERVTWEGIVVPLKAYANSQPTWSPFAVSDMIASGTIASIDLRNISLDKITLDKSSDGGSAFSRPKTTIMLPAGCIFTIRQAE
jgi:hypothetical protein